MAPACSATAAGSAAPAALPRAPADDVNAREHVVGRSQRLLRAAHAAARTVALISCTASWAAIVTAVVWIGSILSCHTSIGARSPASTVSERVGGEDDDDVELAVLQPL